MKLGKYELKEELGRGGFGVVYRALDVVLEVERAVKVLHPVLLVDPSFIERFRREARTAAKLDHPHIVPVYDMDEDQGRYFLAMRYLSGGSLKELLGKEGRLAWERALAITRQAAEGLAFAHDHGLVHRDLKPGNLLFEADGGVRVADFGFARAMADADSTLTSASGGMVGTPAYMAPELWSRKAVGAWTDVYALACVLYEMLSGEVLFAGETPPEVMLKHFGEGPQFARGWDAGAPAGLEAVLLKALAKETGERYADMGTFLAALEGLAQARQQEKARQEAEAQVRREAQERERKAAEERQRREALAPEPSRVVREPAKGDQENVSDGLTRKEIGAEKGKKRNLLWLLGGGGLLVAGGGLVVIVLILIWRSGGDHFSAAKPTMEPVTIQTMTSDKDSMVLVYVPAGEFQMGSKYTGSDEKPVHTVYLDAYWIDQTEVTNAMYAEFLNEKDNQYEGGYFWFDASDEDVQIIPGSGEWQVKPGKENHPVIYVSWYGAQAYCEWVGRRLPSEAEWEKAARGTDERTYPWGNASPSSSLLNYNMNIGNTTKVGSYPDGASPYGALDMAGNVWEWTSSAFWVYPYNPLDGRENPTAGTYKVLRGGDWYSENDEIHAAQRRGDPREMTYDYYGFRCALSP